MPKYKGLVGTAMKIGSEEGVLALFDGLSAGLQRQFVNASLRIGLYVPVRDLITGPLPPGQNPTLIQKIATGMTTGAIGITFANPMDMVKIRLQAQGIEVAKGGTARYSGSFDCYRQIYQERGPLGFWTGWGPNVARNAVINAAELASYDQFKQIFLGYKF